MLIQTKRKLQKWFSRLVWVLILLAVVWMNFNRFYNNNYSNYEKAVDYGRVREYKEEISPIIATVFYQSNQQQKKSISSYLNHWDNYRIQNVKMLIVPTDLSADSRRVVEKLYKEIKNQNQIKYIALVYNENKNISEHQKLLSEVFDTSSIDVFPLNEQATDTEFDIQDYLNDINTMVVFAADLSQDFAGKSGDFLINEALYFAQKNFYKIRVFDEVDSQLAKAKEENYANGVEVSGEHEITRIEREKNNLEQYKNHYEQEILLYFLHNLNLPAKEYPVWPDKTEKTYRLYDRGMVYIRFFGQGGKEIFSRAKIGKNKGIIVGIVELARKAAVKISQPIEKVRIYLLTDLEEIEKDENTPLVNYLERDDGIYIQYRKKSTLLAADERPVQNDELMALLRQRIQLPQNAAEKDIKFYRFKTVEIDYEN